MANLDIYGQPQGQGESWPAIRRALQDLTRGVSYYPYDLLGAPVDVANLALSAVGLGSKEPVLGSDQLRRISQQLGFAQPSTGSTAETVGRFAAGLTNPAAPVRAVQRVAEPTEAALRQIVREIQTTPPVGSVKLPEKVPGLLQPQKSDLGFYSQLEAATLPLQNKGTGEQYLAQISKTSGVKPEELQWTGLEDFLKSRQSVTKSEIQDYLNANRVDVHEVRLESGQRIPLTNEEQARLNALRKKEEIEGLGGLEADEYSDLLNKEIAFEEFYDPTKFSSYTLPGGENYREILLTLPKKRRTEAEARSIFGESMWSRMTPERRQEFMSYPTEASERRQYKSPHFDQPNILAHMRANDRVVDGKKTLFIEEIQSDWHQAGRKEGYKGVPIMSQEQIAEKQSDIFRRFDAGEITRDQRYTEIEALNAAKENLKGVPNAPFKTTWHELALKRAIQEASEKGYDQIAFTTGKTQAERYDLSKQVDYIEYRKSPDGTFELGIADINGDAVDLPKVRYTAEELPDVVGKEIADKIVSGQGQPFQGQSGGGIMTLRGVDLKIGGEGMKGFYDNILPKSLEKLGKKFDAKVGKTEMDGVEVWKMDITPKMRDSVITKGQPLFAIPAIGTGLLGSQMQFEDQY